MATSWGVGAEEMLERAPSICGLEDDPSAFETSHPLVGELHRRQLGTRFGRTGQVFSHLVVAVVGQKVTGSEAARALRGLRERFSAPAPGPRPGLRLPPDADQIAQAPYWAFHELHLEKKRADTLRRVASKAKEINQLDDADPIAAGEYLQRIPGVGVWTLAETLALSHGDPDAVSVGDYHLKNMVVYHLTGRPRGTDDEMVALLEDFRPHRGRVVRLLHRLGHAPKYGPRSVPRNITAI